MKGIQQIVAKSKPAARALSVVRSCEMAEICNMNAGGALRLDITVCLCGDSPSGSRSTRPNFISRSLTVRSIIEHGISRESSARYRESKCNSREHFNTL